MQILTLTKRTQEVQVWWMQILSHWQSVHKKYKFLQHQWVCESIILNVGKSAKQVGYYKIRCVPMHCSIRFTPTNYNNNNRWELKLDRFFLISLI